MSADEALQLLADQARGDLGEFMDISTSSNKSDGLDLGLSGGSSPWLQYHLAGRDQPHPMTKYTSAMNSRQLRRGAARGIVTL